MNFTQFLLILNARKWIILGVLLLAVAVTATVSLLLPKEYTAATTLIIDSKSKDAVTGQLMPSQMFPGYMATQIDIINSSQVANRVVRDLKLAENPATRQQFIEATKGEGTIEQWLANLLLQKVSAEPSRESSIISIGFTGSDPRFAAIVANAFARAYIETSLDLRVAPAKLTAAWFDEQIVQLREKLDQADYTRRTGCRIHTSYWPVRLLWLQDHQAEAFKKTKHWLSIGEYVLMQLFGERRISYSTASWSGLLNQHELEWDAETLAPLPIEIEQLSTLSNEPLQGLSGEWASRWPARAWARSCAARWA